jgi:hypothetical protein
MEKKTIKKTVTKKPTVSKKKTTKKVSEEPILAPETIPSVVEEKPKVSFLDKLKNFLGF